LHEWALAKSIVDTVLEVAKERSVKSVEEVIIVVGEISQIDLDILRLALKELSKGTIAERASFILREEEAVFKCNSCDKTWSFREVKNKLVSELGEDNPIHFVPDLVYALVRCPYCGSPDFELLRGRGVWIESIRGVK